MEIVSFTLTHEAKTKQRNKEQIKRAQIYILI